MTDETENPDDPKNFRHATVTWKGGTAFEGGKEGGPQIKTDGNGDTGPSMVALLLVAAGACSGADVVGILEKMKVKLEEFRIEVTGRRNADYPKRYNKIVMKFFFRGEGLTEANTQRAVDLSVTKYCSVVQTLDPGMPIETEVVIEP